MKTIIFFKSGELVAERHKLAGFHAAARDRGWNVQIVEPVRTEQEAKRAIDFWRPDGVVVSCIARANNLPAKAFGSLPLVFLGRPLSAPLADASFVCLDARRTTEIAARELLRLDLCHYALVHWSEPAVWDGEHDTAFADIMRFNGTAYSTCVPRHSGNRRQRLAELSCWLKGLPRPLGVFALCDAIGVDVIEACRLARLDIPQDVVVISNNNDEELCENARPALSSIEVNLPQAGRLAADALVQRMTTPHCAPLHFVYAPVQLVRRASSIRLKETSLTVSRALDLIHRKACEGLAARDVLRLFTCSRRMAELQFRAATGHSILEAIHEVRLERARHLLATQSLKLDAIANFCGYRSAGAFVNFYRSQTGHPPRSTTTP